MGNNNNCITREDKDKLFDFQPKDKISKPKMENQATQERKKPYTPPPKTKMKQTLDNGNIVCGFLTRMTIEDGTIDYVNGDKFEGAIWEGKAHGKGRIKYQNGDSYEGRFANDLKEGDGLYRFANGNIYRGTFKKDLFDGQGIFRFIQGNVYKGSFWEINLRIVQRWTQTWVWGTLFG